jgi:DNA-binding transcriptional LysR family regulator
VHVYTTERRVDLIEDGIDVTLRVGTIAHEAMVARHVVTYRHVLVASPLLVERLGLPESPDALHRFPCAAWSVGATVTPWRFGDQVFEAKTVLSTNDYAHLRTRALAGEVVTELPPFLAAKAIRERRLIALLPDHPLQEQQLHLLYPSHRHPSAIVRAYLDFCEQHVPQLIEAA